MIFTGIPANVAAQASTPLRGEAGARQCDSPESPQGDESSRLLPQHNWDQTEQSSRNPLSVRLKYATVGFGSGLATGLALGKIAYGLPRQPSEAFAAFSRLAPLYPQAQNLTVVISLSLAAGSVIGLCIGSRLIQQRPAAEASPGCPRLVCFKSLSGQV